MMVKAIGGTKFFLFKLLAPWILVVIAESARLGGGIGGEDPTLQEEQKPSHTEYDDINGPPTKTNTLDASNGIKDGRPRPRRRLGAKCETVIDNEEECFRVAKSLGYKVGKGGGGGTDSNGTTYSLEDLLTHGWSYKPWGCNTNDPCRAAFDSTNTLWIGKPAVAGGAGQGPNGLYGKTKIFQVPAPELSKFLNGETIEGLWEPLTAAETGKVNLKMTSQDKISRQGGHFINKIASKTYTSIAPPNLPGNNKGCYVEAGEAYFGTGGTIEEMETPQLGNDVKRLYKQSICHDVQIVLSPEKVFSAVSSVGSGGGGGGGGGGPATPQSKETVPEEGLAPIKPQKKILHGYLANSYRVDSKSPNFISPGPYLFDFYEGDFSSQYVGEMKKTSFRSDSSSSLSSQMSASVGVDGGVGMFSAAASFSSESMDSSNKKKTRIDNQIKVNKDLLTIETPYPHKRLRPEVKKFLLDESPENIVQQYGSFYAKQVTVGAVFQLTSIFEMLEGESSSSFDASISANYGMFLSASASGGKRQSNRHSCTKTTFKTITQGGDPTIWLHKADPDTLQNKWAKTVQPGHYHPTKYQLRPIWQLLDHDDMDPAKAGKLKEYMTTKWKNGDEETKKKEALNVPAKTKKKMTGYVTIYQPAEQKGSYSYRSVQKSACDFVNGRGVQSFGYGGDPNTLGCWDLDHLFCPDNSRCLKWGSDCYAGRIDVPQGITVETYVGFDKCSSGSKRQTYNGSGGQQNFWNYDHRICQFKFHLDPAYTCGNKPECA